MISNFLAKRPGDHRGRVKASIFTPISALKMVSSSRLAAMRGAVSSNNSKNHF